MNSQESRSGAQTTQGNWRERLYNPYTVMWLVVLMYTIKVATKLSAGYLTNSPVFISDGYHNLSDILQAFAVMVVVYMARRPPNTDYPLGKSNIEFFSSLVIGLSLLVLGAQFALQSLVGLLYYLPQADQAVRAYITFLPDHKPLLTDASSYPWLIGIMAGSGLLSWLVSRYQITVGRSTGHTSLVADGEETASDGRIELIAMLGVVGQFLFGAPWLEYPLALLVATLVIHTGKELFMQAFRALLQHSLPQEVEEEIMAITMDVAGVSDLLTLKTFQVGQVAVCLLTLRTKLGAEKVGFVRLGVEQRLTDYLKEAGYISSEIHLKFKGEAVRRYRIAYAIAQSNTGMVVAPDLQTASHLAICDVEDGHITRARMEVKPAQPEPFLHEKLVDRLFVFSAGQQAPALKQLIAVKPGEKAIEIVQSTVLMPDLLGL
ncbi:MAG TPA: cation diffusion facilitator family transporter [Candidatus Obscuribacter sp.]|nr:cation diffusion facilitator family transporter [Candidatus Obscuribacter sp.]HNG74241.1 cation diffusion facilitator family transporter [Candidatus Obscuribacter sp.]